MANKQFPASAPRRGHTTSCRPSRPTPATATATALLLLAVVVLSGAGIASAARCYRSLSQADFPHCQLLSPTFALHWAVRGDNISLGLDADTGGYPDSWLALALSGAGGMHGADMIIVAGPRAAAGGAGGGWRAIDAHSLDFVAPQPDDSQDVTLMGTPLSGGNHTVAVVTRRLRTCDPWDWSIQVGVPQTVSWAYGRRWPSKHVARGNSVVFFVPKADRLWGVANATATTPAASPKASLPANAFAATKESPLQQKSYTSLFAASGTDEATVNKSVGREPRIADDGDSDDDQYGSPFGASVSASEPVLELDVVMPNVTVPDNTTTNYLCTHVVMPNDRKYHIVSSRGIVRSELIHHMILFACSKPPVKPRLGQVFECSETGGGEGCSTFNIGWAPGQDRIILPPTVGIPIGESDSTYYSLQVHYNNPEAIAGVVDASGFKLLYTPKLRPNDAAVLTVGQQAIIIPPGIPKYTLRPNVCPSTCTSQLTSPLRLLLSGLHMHTLGKSIVTQHIRNGTELPPVGSKRFYDFNFQSTNPVNLDSSILLPGDSLVTTCSYDSTSRPDVTRYGDSTRDEMCFNFILYYPKNPNFTFCGSLDGAGDPGVALCGGREATRRLGATLSQLAAARNASAASAPAAAAALPATAAAAAAAAQPQPQDLAAARSALPALSALSALPALAPFFQSGVLVRVPAADTKYDPYGKSCPDMWYMPA